MRRGIFAILLATASFATEDRDETLRRLYNEGERALQAGQHSEAERRFLELRTLTPDTAEVHGRLGLVYFEERKFALAAQSFRTALHLKPALPKTDILLALADAELGHYKEAQAALQKGFRQTSDSELRRECGLRLLRSQTALGQNREAVATALELNRMAPNDPEVLYHTSRIYANFAYLNLQQLSSIAPQSVWRRQAAAEAYESAGNTELAVLEYRKVLQQQPDRPGIHYRIGRALMAGAKGNGSSEEALKEFSAELAIDGSNANASYEMAELLRKSGRLKEAETQFRNALDADHDFPEAQQGLAAVLLAEGRPKDALPLLKAAATSRPQDEVTFYRLGQAYRMTGDAAAQAQALAEYVRLRSQRQNTESMNNLDAVQQVTPQKAEELSASDKHHP